MTIRLSCIATALFASLVVVPLWGQSGTIAFNTPVTVAASSGVSSLTFSGVSGQIISLSISFNDSYTTSILNPDSSTLWASGSCSNLCKAIGQVLPSTGVYTIIFTPGSGTTGGATLSLTSNTTNTTISFGTPATTSVSSTAPAQSAFNFTGTASQVVTLDVNFGNPYYAYILNPDATTFWSSGYCGGTLCTAIGKTLPATGTYTILFFPIYGPGVATFSLSSNTTNPTMSFGTPATTSVSSTAPAQSAFNFTGTASQVVTLDVNFGNPYYAYILNPDATTFWSSGYCGGPLCTAMGKTLPSTGTYTILFFPIYGPGVATFSLSSNTANPAISFGTPATTSVSSTAPAQSAFNFTGTASQVVTLDVNFGNPYYAYILNPDATTFWSSGYCGGPLCTAMGKTLPSTGTYTILFFPIYGPGVATFSLSSNTANPAISFGTPATTSVSSTAPAQSAFNFTGTASQVVTLDVNFGNPYYAYILNPDATTFWSSGYCGGPLCTAIGKTLPSTGTYTILFFPIYGPGVATFSLSSNTTNPTISFGTTTTPAISATAPAQVAYDFIGNSGNTASLSVSYADPYYAYLLNPDGSVLWNSGYCNGTCSTSARPLSYGGAYMVVLVPFYGTSTSASIVLSTQGVTLTLAPPGGTYTSPQLISMTVVPSGASIRYTTDGTNPTETTGILYSTPIPISASVMLKAIAYQAGWEDSAVVSAAYVLPCLQKEYIYLNSRIVAVASCGSN